MGGLPEDGSPEVHPLEKRPTGRRSQHPFPVDQVVRTIIPPDVLWAVRRTKSSEKVAVEIARRDLVSESKRSRLGSSILALQLSKDLGEWWATELSNEASGK